MVAVVAAIVVAPVVVDVVENLVGQRLGLRNDPTVLIDRCGDCLYVHERQVVATITTTTTMA